jgi:hypothetical protein
MRCVAHPDVDGSGKVRSTLEVVVVTEAGDIFVMNMVNSEIGANVMENHVVEFEPPRRIVWEPVMRSMDNPEFQSDVGVRALHQWGWTLDPLDSGHTRVTEFFDCRRSPEWLHKATREGATWRPAI